jgi:hypothetical protein
MGAIDFLWEMIFMGRVYMKSSQLQYILSSWDHLDAVNGAQVNTYA